MRFGMMIALALVLVGCPKFVDRTKGGLSDAEYAEAVLKIEASGRGNLMQVVEELASLDDDELDERIEEEYSSRGLWPRGRYWAPPDSMEDLCNVAIYLRLSNVIRSMIRRAKDTPKREVFMSHGCRFLHRHTFLPEHRVEAKDMRFRHRKSFAHHAEDFLHAPWEDWAKSIDYKKKPHLVKSIVYLKEPVDKAKEIISDKQFDIGIRCIAMDILAEYGSLADLAFVEQHRGKLGRPPPDCGIYDMLDGRYRLPLGHSPDCLEQSLPKIDCADEAARRLRERFKTEASPRSEGH